MCSPSTQRKSGTPSDLPDELLFNEMEGIKINKFVIKLAFTIFLSVILLSSCTKANHDEYPKTTDTMIVEQTTEMWIEDLDYLFNTLEDKHYDLFYDITKDNLYKEVDLLKMELDDLDDISIYLRLRSIVASIGDGHTRLFDKYEYQWFPIRVSEFEEGLIVTATTEENKELIGFKLLSINGITIEDIIDKLSPSFSSDNKFDLKSKVLSNITCAELLAFYNVIKLGESTLFELESNDGKIIKIELNAKYLDQGEYISFAELYPGVLDISSLKNRDKPYWFEYEENNDLVYLQYNSCVEDPNISMSEFATEVDAFLTDNSVDYLIVDLRYNSGGDSRIIEPLINIIRGNAKINQMSNLFLLIGNRTYSSAILNTLEFSSTTNVKMIGKPTGGKPNHYGEVKMFELPNSGINGMYSTKYFKYIDEDLDAIYPDVEIENSYFDLIEGKDSVVEAIISGEIRP